MICSKNRRMLAFLIDRRLLFPIWIVLMNYFLLDKYFPILQENIINMNFFYTIYILILIIVVAYVYLLIIYFIYFVLGQYIFNYTIGKKICSIKLVEINNEEITKVSFKKLIIRYLYLYVMGVGALGYMYPFHSSKESLYDKITNTYVIEQ